jgi:hypothetical protein
VFEYHGWVTIGVSSADEDETALLDRIVERVRRAVRDFGDIDLVDLRWANGVPMLHFAGMDKHGGVMAPELLDLFTRVGTLAPGSYGLLHVWDDQDLQHDNEFRVHRMARGQVTELADTYLSPVAPVIVDAYPEFDAE